MAAENDSLSFSLLSSPTYGALGSLGSATFVAPGNYSSSVTYSAFDNLSAGLTYHDNFTYLVTDNNSENSTVALVNLTVTGTNDVPVANDVSAIFTEGTPGNITLSATDVDGDNITSFQIVGSPSLGTASIPDSAVGSLLFTPAERLSAGKNYTEVFTYSATDNNSGTSASANISLTVTGTNDVPVASNLSISVESRGAYTGTLPYVDVDQDDVHTFAIVSPPSQGEVTLANTRSNAFTYTSTSAAATSDAFSFRVTDNLGASATATVSVVLTNSTVISVNDDNASVTETVTSIGDSSVNAPKGDNVQVIGNPGESTTTVVQLPESVTKPETEIRATLNLDGTQAIAVDTTNPAATATTTSFNNLPAGTVTEIGDDGSVTATLNVGNNKVTAVVDPKGASTTEVEVTAADGSVLKTSLAAPEGAQTSVSGNTLLTTVAPEAVTQSSVERMDLTVNEDGSVATSTPIKDANGNVVAESQITLPAGGSTSLSYTGTLRSTLPTVTNTDGSSVTPSVSQNANGELEVQLSVTNSDGQSSKVVLPKLTAGSSVSIQDGGVAASMPLATGVPVTNREARDAAATEVGSTGLYMGRDPQTNAAVYVAAAEANTTLEVLRPFNSSRTSVVVSSGSVSLTRGDTQSTLAVGESFLVTNSARQFTLAEGANLFSFPTAEDLSAFDWEVLLGNAHSFWTWNADNQSWQAFSPDLTTAVSLANRLEVPQVEEARSGDGVYVQSDYFLTLTMSDAPGGTLRDTTSDTTSEWRLLGNNTDQPVAITELLATLPTNVLALWRSVDGAWQVYSTDAEILAQRDAEGLAEWSINEPLAVGEAYWVQVQPPNSNQRSLRQPPM